MRALVYPSDRGPCGNYRLILPAKALRQQHPDWHIEIADFMTMKREEVSRARVDVVVIQRPTPREWPNIIRGLRARGIAVVVDMDDDLSSVHPRHAAANAIKRLHINAAEACEEATLVTATTPALVDRYGFGHGVVIPNCIPAHYLEQSHRDNPDIGWAGDIRSHPADLRVVGTAMKRMEALGAQFYVAGPGNGVARAWDLKRETRASGTVSLSDWPFAVSRIGIGVAPLEPSAFNAAKSKLKILEMSGCGVPWIASPTPDYVSLHEEGAGLLARTPDEWFRHLRRLFRSRNLRQEMSEAGREVARKHTIQDKAHLWAEAWTSAVDIERKK